MLCCDLETVGVRGSMACGTAAFRLRSLRELRSTRTVVQSSVHAERFQYSVRAERRRAAPESKRREMCATHCTRIESSTTSEESSCAFGQATACCWLASASAAV